jgi:DNA-binding NarL/FixJ family response regulator
VHRCVACNSHENTTDFVQTRAYSQAIEQIETPESFNFSKHEVEVLEKITLDLNYNQIADQLFISAKTARKYIENICQKLPGHSKLGAAAQKNKEGVRFFYFLLAFFP